MKRLSLLSLFLAATYSPYAQDIAILEQEVNPGAVIEELKLPPPKVEGTYYLYDAWHAGEVLLSSKLSIKSYPIKYDLQHHNIELKLNDEIKVCASNLIDSFKIVGPNKITETYIHCRFYSKSNEDCLNGVYKRIFKHQDVELLEHRYVIEKEPTYVEAIDMGSRNKKIIQQTDYYMAKNKMLLPIYSAKKKNEHLFGEHFKAVLDHSKQHKLKFNNATDLHAIIKYYLSLQ